MYRLYLLLGVVLLSVAAFFGFVFLSLGFDPHSRIDYFIVGLSAVSSFIAGVFLIIRFLKEYSAPAE